MSEGRDNTRAPADLLVPEAKRSLAGFVASLRQRDGFLQASLHAKDLSAALMSLGQTGPSEVFSELSRQLALRNTGVMPVAERFAGSAQAILTALAAGQTVADDAGHDNWVEWVREARGGANYQELIKNFGDPRPQPALPSTAEVASDTPKDRVRMQALALLQEARRLNFGDDERTVLRLDAVLSELQDWMLRPLQHRIGDLFSPTVIQGGEIGVDPPQAERLAELDTVVRRAREVRITYRSLLVFLDLRGLVLNAEEYSHVAATAHRLRGRVQKVEEGYRLVLPSSVDRQRVTPFHYDGRRWAIANAQLLTFHPAVAGASMGHLETVEGDLPRDIPVERILPSENMNVRVRPAQIEAPSAVTQVAENGRGEIFLIWPATG